MKLSAKLREEEHRNPLLRAKVPISVLGFALTSSLVAGDPSDLSFSLQTNFVSGPSLKLSYLPSASASVDSASSFSLTIKSGSGLFGSHRNSPLSISAHFSLTANSNHPTFSLQFKPQLGDFSLKKTILSQPSANKPTSPYPNPNPNSTFELSSIPNSIFDPNTSSNPNNGPYPNGGAIGALHANSIESNSSGVLSIGGIRNFVPRMLSSSWGKGSCCEKDGVLSGLALRARTTMPVLEGVVMNLRWGVNFPQDWGKKLPFLTVDKIGIERIKLEKEVKAAENKDTELLKGMCFCMGRDLEALRKENSEVKQALEKLGFSVQGRDVKKGVPFTKPSSSNKKKGEEDDKKGGGGGEMESELQKAIRASSTSSS